MINPFKKRPKKTSIIHRDYKKLIEYVTTVKDENGKDIDLYEFKNADDIPASRFSKLNEFVEDMQRGIDRTELQFYVEEAIESQNLGTAQGNAKVVNILQLMNVRMKIAYDMDLMLRLISCALFTIDEDIYTYDHDIGTNKIEWIEKSDLTAFFLAEPVKKYWTQQSISTKDFEVITAQRELKRKTLDALKTIGVFGGTI